MALPDDGQRYEIVDGVLYMSPSPSDFHQETAYLIAYYLMTHVKFTGLGRVLGAPFDVKLAFKTVVQPDVLVYLQVHDEQIEQTLKERIPDLVIEVASPSTAKYDRRQKYHAYEQAGIREYWIVNPLQCSVEVLVLEAGTYQLTGVFSGKQIVSSQVIPHFPVQAQQFFE
jgi:Uma2 family endonuclease